MLTVLDLFSGIGGISLGLEATGGFRTVAFCEIEPFPRLVLAKHWPGVPIFEDVRTLSAESLGGLRPDCIVGGFPCQDISVAGKGKGLHGHRSGLWFEFARLVGEFGPRWVLAENVGALRTRGVDRVCSDLEGEGYAVWPLLVGAWAAGAPHRRERVWIVAHCPSARRERGATVGTQSGEKGLAVPAIRCASELSNSDAGRCGREGDEVQAGRDEPERTASGVGLADPPELHSDAGDSQPRRQVPESGNHRGEGGGRDERPVGDTTSTGQQAERGSSPFCGGDADSAVPIVPKPEGERRAQQGHGRYGGSWLGCDGPRWPARPGEPQHEWEEPRLAYAGRGGSDRRQISARSEQAGQAIDRSGCAPLCVACDGWAGHGRLLCEECEPRSSELPLGSAANGLPERLARRANRESLKALGNSVVPQVVYAIGRAILEAEANP